MSRKNNLILVKHSLPKIIKDVPAREWKLSIEGQKKAEKLAERLVQYQPDFLVSSDEPKAIETAEIIGSILGLSCLVISDLHEHDRGQSPLYSMDEFQSLVKKFFDNPDILVFGSETANQALARFRESLLSVLDFNIDKNIIVVSHGTVISLFVSWLTGMDGYDLWKDLGLPSFVELDMRSRAILRIENII